MEKKELIAGMKSALAEAVGRKRRNTRDRVAYKKATPVSNPERLGKLRMFWVENSELKEETRHHGLALAFVRGRRYWVTERISYRGFNPDLVAEFAGATVEEINAWGAEKPSAEEKAAFDEHLRLSREKAKADYLARSATKQRAA